MKKTAKSLLQLSMLIAVITMAFYGGMNESKIRRALGVENIHAQGMSQYDDRFPLMFEALDIVRSNYIDDTVSEEKTKDLTYGAIRGMLRSLGDQYTRFMDPKAYNNMSIDTKGKFGGIGITIGIRNEQLTVISPIEGTPAYKVGLKAGDIIIKIDGVATEEMALDDAVARIRGEQGTPVKLTIWRRGFEEDGKEFDIVRDIIELKPINTAKMLDGKIGYVKLDTFSELSAEKLEEQITMFNKQGMKAMILDLRYNPGGLLPSAIDVARLFVNEGPIVHRESRSGRTVTYYAKRKKIVNVPTVVLVNKYSASASEIVAGALQDHEAATLIGETTFGKGLVQTVFRLSDNSAILVTTDKYLTAKKRDINKMGIVPDIAVSQDSVDAHEKAENGEEDDDRAPGKVGKFAISELHGKNGVVFKKNPLKDIHYTVVNNKRYLNVDDVAQMFGTKASIDEKTGLLFIDSLDPDEEEEQKTGLDLEKDVQLKKAVEYLKEKI